MQVKKCALVDFTTISLTMDNIYEVNCEKLIVQNGSLKLLIDSFSINNNTLTLFLKTEVNIKRTTNIIYENLIFNVSYVTCFNSTDFNKKYFSNIALGAIYSQQATLFRLWAPAALYVNVLIYENGDPYSPDNDKPKKFKMLEQENGIWTVEIKGNLKGYFYTYELKVYDNICETIDPYAKACGIDGFRGAIVDLKDTNPPSFLVDKGPKIVNYTDAIIYETSVRDISIHPDSGTKFKGKFMALSEENTVSSKKVATVLNHLIELGITHVQLMPIFDYSYKSVDEKNPYKYNWGYDPQNYNIPEGSYSSDPYKPTCRIYELKKAISQLHKHNIGVIMDVVYNHVYEYENSSFEKIFPGYYFRHFEDGSTCNGSGCGNDFASEKPMVRKYIIDSLLYWANEYHIDGFRFDLMGLHDIETMNILSETLNSNNKKYIFYGEGWNLNTGIPDYDRSTIYNNARLKDIAFFNDMIRDAVKGSVFNIEETGFVNGKVGMEYLIKYAVTGSTFYPDLNKGMFDSPEQSINFTACHDNYTLWDKLRLSCKESPEEDIIAMNKLADGIILTSLGIPFIHSGSDSSRTKNGIENSYNSTDTINRIDWHRKHKYKNLFDYYKGLIELRKEHKAFRINKGQDVLKYLSFLDTPPNTVGFILKNYANSDYWKNIIVIYNASKSTQTIAIPYDTWHVVVDANNSGIKVLENFKDNYVKVNKISMKVLYAD